MRIEFFMDKTGCLKKSIYFKLDQGEWSDFEKLSPEQLETVFSHLLKFDKARMALLHLSGFFPGNKRDILRQFILCNWTRLNNRMDISDRKLDFEYIDCPFKHSDACPYKGKGIVCIKLNPDEPL